MVNLKFRGDAIDMILWMLSGALLATAAWLVYIYYRFGWGPDSPVFR